MVLALVLFAGLLIRLWISPSPGDGFDVGTNKGWSYSSVILGPGKSYTTQLKGGMLPNYPPLSLLFFHATGWIYQHTLSPSLDIEQPAFQTMIKLPAIFADILTAALLASLIARWKKNKWQGVLAAAIYLLHPAPIHDSAFWGQTDALYALFLVAAFGAFTIDRCFTAGMCMAFALLTKLQAVACLPLFAVLSLKNGWQRGAKSFIGAWFATVLVLLPFWWQGFIYSAIRIYFSTIGFYDIVSSSAYNFWWSLYGDSAGSLHDTELLFNVLSYRTIGYLLFSASILFPIILLWRSLKPSTKTQATLPAIFFAASLSSYAFFLWNTQMHERYGFAFLPLGLIVAFVSERAALLYLSISLLIYANLLGWLPAGIIDRTLYDTFPMLDILIASALTLLFFRYAALAFDIRKMIPHKK